MTSKVLPVLQTIKTGGSGRGISYYNTVMSCSRKARFMLEKEQTRKESYKLDSAFTGTIFHALMEMFYLHGTKFVVEIDQTGAQQELTEAQRLLDGYSRFFAKDDWETVATEVLLPGTNEDGTLAFESETAKKIGAVLGIPEFACRIDLVARVYKKHVDNIMGTRNVLLEPGIYLVDHKTAARREENRLFKFLNDLQMDTYMMAYNAAHDEPCLGMLVNNVYRYKALTAQAFETYLIPYPSEDRQAMIKEYLSEAFKRRHDDIPNLSNCHSGYGSCQYLLDGSCSRRKESVEQEKP